MGDNFRNIPIDETVRKWQKVWVQVGKMRVFRWMLAPEDVDKLTINARVGEPPAASTKLRSGDKCKLRLRRADDLYGGRMTRRAANLLGVNPADEAPVLPPWGASEKRAAAAAAAKSLSGNNAQYTYSNTLPSSSSDMPHGIENSFKSVQTSGQTNSINFPEIDAEAFAAGMLADDDADHSPVPISSSSNNLKRNSSQISMSDLHNENDDEDGGLAAPSHIDDEDDDQLDELPEIDENSGENFDGDAVVDAEGAHEDEASGESADEVVHLETDDGNRDEYDDGTTAESEPPAEASLFASAAFFAGSNTEAD